MCNKMTGRIEQVTIDRLIDRYTVKIHVKEGEAEPNILPISVGIRVHAFIINVSRVAMLV